MEFRINANGPLPGIDSIEDALRALDPAAVADIQPGTSIIRVSATVEPHELVSLMHGLGLPLVADHIERVPSICCGGCSG
ncbi:hypothetical protein [Novilysobacter selenitireducens]|uniref:Uncharacterized protein n=1 Tax=Novilysobacter selenitireducens TaxID=2872639 RepID=A0ABS7T7Z0_9GAMM|nr:hypothetical protein [Lysobacter selenitireducens]MBZ4039999.1 hypothetical protein [Lysobacter selenitireducens]